MADIKVNSQAAIVAPKETQDTLKNAAKEAAKQVQEAKKMVFGDKGKALLKAAATGALIGGGAALMLGTGVAAGAAAGMAVGTAAKAVGDLATKNHDGAKKAAKTALATAAVTLSIGPIAGALTGLAFATGAAQKAAEKINNFLSDNADKMVAKAPAK